ncbi:MAG: response regulator, partial [Nitrospinaceae bacterium]|nr:response regulator [Nitrospinaceae bacterium]
MNVLVVEDDLDISEFYKKILVARGHNVEVFSSAEEGLKAYQNDPFPLIILDWMLPGMDGLELCDQIRAISTEKTPYILVSTSRSAPADLESVLLAGADDYIPKPVDEHSFGIRLAIAEKRISLANQAKNLEQEEQKRSFQFQIADQITKAVGMDIAPDKLFSTILHEIRKEIPYDRAVISTFAPETNEYQRLSDDGDKIPASKSSKNPGRHILSHRVHKEKRAFIISNLQEFPWRDSDLPPIVVPLATRVLEPWT